MASIQTLQKLALKRAVMIVTRSYPTGPGSGVGKGGGGGGTVREAGGAFGVMEAAREGQYFYEENKRQLANLKKHLEGQMDFHEEAIKRHQKAIEEIKLHSTKLHKHASKHK